MGKTKRPGAFGSDRTGNFTLGSKNSHTTATRDPQRLFVATDGTFLIADRLGTRRATGAALALLPRPLLRLTGFREGVCHG